MNEKMLPYLAILLSIVAISAAVVIQPETEIKAGSIDSKKLAQDSVSSNELANKAVTSEKIADGSINDKHINDSGISKIKDSSIGANQLTQQVLDMVNCVSELGNNSITSIKIKDYTIVNKDIKNNTISSGKILDDTISSDDIGSDAVGNDELQDDSVDGDNILDGSVGSDDIENGGVNTNDISENAVTDIWQNNTDLFVGIDSTTEDGGEDPSNPTFDNLSQTFINFTTGNNPVLFLFSGVFGINAAHDSVQIILFIDDVMKIPTARKGTSAAADKTFTLAFNYIETLTAGPHSVRIGWRVEGGNKATGYNRVLDIIELKK